MKFNSPSDNWKKSLPSQRNGLHLQSAVPKIQCASNPTATVAIRLWDLYLFIVTMRLCDSITINMVGSSKALLILDKHRAKAYCTYTMMSIKPLKRQAKIAADDILIFYFYLSKKIRLDFSCESSASQRIHLKHQVLFSLKNNEKIFRNVVCCSHDWRFKG